MDKPKKKQKDWAKLGNNCIQKKEKYQLTNELHTNHRKNGTEKSPTNQSLFQFIVVCDTCIHCPFWKTKIPCYLFKPLIHMPFNGCSIPNALDLERLGVRTYN